MKFDRMSINKVEIELSDAELIELADIIELAIEHLEEYNDVRLLKEHNREWYRNTANLMKYLASYK